MRQLAAGVAAGLLLAGAGLLLWRGDAEANDPLPPRAEARADGGDLPDPPRADERTREQRRFDRYDKDRNSQITRDEYLASRRKAYAKLDADGDGRLSFDEWAIRTTSKFVKADADGSGVLTAAEFATTRVVRKSKPKCDCPPVRDEEED